VDTWKSPKHTLFCHGFDISIYRRATDIGAFSLHFLIDIVSGKMTTFTGIADDFTVLVLAHTDIMRKILEKAKNISYSYMKKYFTLNYF
jgi:uncharacterized membrane protein YkvA (DUF1232 family)